MEIKDIIKSDSDRLFIVDPECYIIFTGESTNDIQPFIRIGNWTDMPVELIPLIENIIVTDNLVGNPSHEQFNIDVRYLSTNRYIGSKAIVAKFLDFQKIFGLDLTNASVVDIEKDLPVLSKEKNISHKDQFIGVFYRDGNFKVLLNKNVIFDLNSLLAKPITNNNFHDLLSDTNKFSARYEGSGLVIAGHNPLFYHKKYFFAYLFPDRYFRDFSVLGIDPGKIQALFHPSLNLVNLSKFLKWLNHSLKKIKIFTNNPDIDLVKKIFSNCSIKNEPFSSLNFKTGAGLAVQNYPGTYNLKLSFEGPPLYESGMAVAFIKGSSGIKSIIKEKLDALVISYTAFEEMHMLLKSTPTPCLIVDDGNKNITKLGGMDHTVLRPGMQYEFRKFNILEEIIALPEINDEAVSRSRSDPETLADAVGAAIKSEGPEYEKAKSIFNLMALVRMFLTNTRDRKLASRLKNAAASLERAIDQSALIRNAQKCKVVLALYNGSIFQVLADCAASEAKGRAKLFDEIIGSSYEYIDELTGNVREHYDRILEDRARLRQLIDIYVASKQYSERNMPELDKLNRAIASRKEEYHREGLSLDHSDSRSIDSKESNVRGMHDRQDKRARTDTYPQTAAYPQMDKHAHPEMRHGPKQIFRSAMQFTKSLPLAVKIGLPLFLLLAALAVLFVINSGDIRDRLVPRKEEHVVQSREIDTQYRELGKKHNIRIRDNDILKYANQVAVKNGYHKIAETNLKEKNPDWIYPFNIFMMLDDQRVVVSKGDTLWNLSKNKLIESTIQFNETMKKADAAGAQEKALLIERARKHAFTREQRELIEKAGGGLPKGEKAPPDERR